MLSLASCLAALFPDSLYFEEHWVFMVWTRVLDGVFVFCPWEFCAVSHGVDFGKNSHQSAVAYSAFDCPSVEIDLVADFAAETAFSLHAFNCDFNIIGHVVFASCGSIVFFDIFKLNLSRLRKMEKGRGGFHQQPFSVITAGSVLIPARFHHLRKL